MRHTKKTNEMLKKAFIPHWRCRRNELFRQWSRFARPDRNWSFLSLRPKDNQYDAGLGHWLAKLNQGDDRLRWKVTSATFNGHPREAKHRMIVDCNSTLDEKKRCPFPHQLFRAVLF